MPKTFKSVSPILPWPIPKYRVWKSADVSVCVCVCVCVCKFCLGILLLLVLLCRIFKISLNVYTFMTTYY